MEEEGAALTEGTLVSEEPDPPEIPWLFGLSIAIPAFAVVLFFMMKIFGPKPIAPVDPPPGEQVSR